MTEQFNFANHPHRRRNPLLDEWVLVSPHRNKRPWQGQIEPAQSPQLRPYDPDCYLCPGNQRMGGASNPNYANAYVFDNDFPALNLESPTYRSMDPLFSVQAEQGECRVMAYSPNHSKTLAELEPGDIQAVIREWSTQSGDLGQRFDWVQIFENKGETMGCSMPHPHGQIWAQTQAPTLVKKEHTEQATYYAQHGKPLLLDYAQREADAATRVVAGNADWLVVVPYWAAWPFETLLLPLFSVQRLTELEDTQQQTLAELLSELLIRYDNLFECAFPYSMGWHSAPFNSDSADHWQLHAHFYPPLLRSATVRKFMVGYEMLTEPQRDLTPEQAAQMLREVSATHYKTRPKAAQ